MRRIPLLVTLFFGTALLAAPLCWLIWMTDPDYFVVQQEVNIYPLSTLQLFLSEEHIAGLTDEAIGLSDLMKVGAPLLASAQRLRDEQARLSTDMNRLTADLDKASSVLESNRAKRIEEFRQREIAAFDRKHAEIQQEIDKLAEVTPQDAWLRAMIAATRAQLANNDVQKAVTQLEISNDVLTNLRAFAQEDDLQRLTTLEQQAHSARERINAL